MSADLVFRISADLAEVKSALAELRAALKNTGAGSSTGLSSVNKQLDDTAGKAQQAATAQARAARQAADAQEREARRVAATQQRLQADLERQRRKDEAEKDRQARKEVERQRQAEDSAKRQATAQQRALAPQLTDIGVGLATGQSPLMVLLQQGGQLKDLFGGIVPAARAVGTAVAGIVTPVTVLAAAIGVLAIAYVKGAEESARFRRIVLETGGVAGQTAADLDRQAEAISRLSGVTRASAADTIAQVVASGKFAGQQIGIVARAAEQMRASAGKDIAETVGEFAKLADEPVKGAEELNRKFGFLNGTLAQQIRTLKEQGRTQEASTLAMQAYAGAVAERAPKIRENIGLIEKAWRAVKEGTKSAGDALLNIGRPQDDQKAFNDLIKRRQELQQRLDKQGGLTGGRRRGTDQRELDDINARIQAMADAEVAAQKDANRSAAQARAVDAQGRLQDEAKRFETSVEVLTKEKTRIVNDAAQALADAQIAGDAEAQKRIIKARDEQLAGLTREGAKVGAAGAQSNAELVRDDTDRTISELQRLFDRGLVSAREFYTKRRDLQVQAVDAEIAAQRAQAATTNEPAELARIGAQIRILERKKADIRRDAIREEASATQAQQERQLETETGLQIDALNRNLDALQRYFEDAKVSTADFYRARLILQEQAIDADLALARKRLQSQDLSPEDRARILADVTKLERDREAVRLQSIRDGDRAARDLQQQLDQARAQDLENQGQVAAAAQIRVEAQFRDLLKRLEADGNAAGVKLIKGLISTEVARAQFDELKRLIDQQTQAMQAKIVAITQQQTTGAISGVEAERQIQQVRAESITQLDALNAKLQELAASTNDPAIKQGALDAANAIRQIGIDGAGGLDKAIQALRGSMAELEKGFASAGVNAGVDALSGFFTDLASGTKTAGEALRDFVRGFAASMAQIAAKALATYLVLQLLDAIYPGLGKATAATMSVGVKHAGGMVGGPGPTRNVSPLLFAGAPRFHSGGMVGLKAGEVPAILQTGEEVLARNDPRNQANGGGGNGSGSGYRIVNVLDPSLVSGYLESSQGERSVLNVIGRNPSQVRQIIGA